MQSACTAGRQIRFGRLEHQDVVSVGAQEAPDGTTDVLVVVDEDQIQVSEGTGDDAVRQLDQVPTSRLIARIT